MKLILPFSFFAPGLALKSALKGNKLELYFSTFIDMLLMVKKGIRRGICHFIYGYVKATNK